MILHTLVYTVAVIAAYADTFVAAVATGRHALRVRVALRRVRRAVGQHASIVDYAESGIARALVARTHRMIGATFVLLAVGVVVTLI